MDQRFQKFLRGDIDLAPIGIERREDNTPYFCTPKGASIFGWAGVDGIHFCFIRSFGNMVFAVSPMNGAPDYVHPIARTFEDFLRLLLACSDATVLEQAWMWDEAKFETFLRDNPPLPEQKETLSEIADKMNLKPMEQPWEYIKALQASFDYSRIKYTEDYYDVDMNPAAELAPLEWKVYFNGNFWGHHGKDRAGMEVRIDRQFDWAGCHWMIPAAYSCSKGLVVDFCMRVDADKICAFMERWHLSPENDSCENFTREQQEQMELENPLILHFRPTLTVNGQMLQTSHGCSVCFNPCLPDGAVNELEGKWAADHYGLDTTFGWVICRDAFPWKTKRRPQIETLDLTMEQQPYCIPGPHFKTHAPGDSFTFSHPVSGKEYTLTVQELEQQILPKNSFGFDRYFYPTHYIAMSYTLTPEPLEKITIQDCGDGDKPLEIAPADVPFSPTARNDAACIGIIGGADGPTAIVFGGSERKEKLCAAYSALHFEPIQGDVEWRVRFIVKQFEEVSLSLI